MSNKHGQELETMLARKRKIPCQMFFVNSRARLYTRTKFRCGINNNYTESKCVRRVSSHIFMIDEILGKSRA